ncbi:MAG TPA: FimV/HubP family polar landmark protein [Pseudomonadales bacterium]|nr:FimV/HubP family polar landmark protein [Pseudomonadales bacterium]
MFTKLKAISAIVIATYASPALALGVGSIDMNSSMNEPLNATIQLYGTEGMSTGQLIARMGSMQDFERAGVIREYFLDDIRFSVEIDNTGGGVIRLRTDNPVVEPYLNFVLDLRWPDGRILREYTALIDFMPLEQAAPVKPANVSTNNDTKAREEAVTTAVRFGQADGQYRVANGDTLWDIALQVRPSRAYSPQQTMRAIVDNNPQAFSGGNINGLRAGSVLDLPSETQIANVDGNEARRWVRNQNTRWTTPDVSPVESVADTRVVEAPVVVNEAEGAYLRLARADDDVTGDHQVAEDTPDLVDTDTTQLAGPEVVDEATQQRLATTLESLDLSERQNEELQARLAALEEQVQTMQRLMMLKDQQLANMQASPEAPEDMLKNPSVLGGIGALLLAALGWLLWSRRKPKDTVPGDMPAPVFAMPDRPQEVEPVPSVPVAERVVTEVAAEKTSVASPVVAPVSHQSPSAFEEEVRSSDHAVALQAETTPIEESLTEVDIYVAYGRAVKALELVKGIYAEHPHNEAVQLKLLEVAAAAGVSAEYVEVRDALQGSSDADIQAGLLKLAADFPEALADDTEASSALTSHDISDESSDSSQDVPEEETLGWDIGLEAGAGVTGTDKLESEATDADFSARAESFDIPAEDLAVATETDLPLLSDEDFSLDSDALLVDDESNDTLKALEQSASFDGDEMDFDSLELDDSAFDEDLTADVAAEALPDLDMGLEAESEDLALDDVALLEDEHAPLKPDTKEVLEDLADLDFEASEADVLGDLDDFDLDTLGDLERDLSDDDEELSLGDLSLEDGDDVSLDDIMASAFPDDETEGLLDDTDDMTTKLDMARAYIEMGEKESAVEVLDEVIQGGTAEQQSEAAELKGTLS